jgi:tRNA(Ile)-lysidine synthase
MPKQPPHLQLDEYLLRAGQRIGAAVSGGADSVALLRTLLARRAALGLVLSVIHVHHGIRGEEADRDQAFVERLAVEHGVPAHIHRVDTPSYTAHHGETLEEAARHLRYGYFRKLLESGTIDAIATAHTLDDQAETVLQKLLRGAWTEGLGGISPVIYSYSAVGQEKQGTILRPLLSATRASVEAYLQALNQPWCEDSTNRDTGHTRNRIRHELLPELRDYNPQIASQLSRMAAIARDEEAYWQREIARIGPGLVLPGKPVRGGGRASSTNPDEASIALEIDRLRPLGTAIQRRLLRWAAQQLHCTLDFEHTEKLMLLCGFGAVSSEPGGKRWYLDGEVYAQRTAREIQFVRRPGPPATPPALEVALTIPGELSIPELGLLFRTTQLDPSDAAPPAIVRYVRPGDRVTPRYSRSPKTIKETLERLHQPAAERQLTPVVVWKDEIIWLRGIELDPAALPTLPFALEIVPIGSKPR